MLSQIFSQNLRTIRKARGITQTEIAKRLFVTPQTVSKWESGALPDVENLCLLAQVLQTTPDRLLGVTEKMQEVLIGIDAGGTKTDAVLLRKDGTVLARKRFAGANPNACGLQTCAQTLCEAITSLSDGKAVAGVFAGVAGITAAGNRGKVLSILKKHLPDVPIELGSDVKNVIASVQGSEKCVAVISGTGNAVFAWDGKTLTRFGGYGYLFDGAGSGYDIGRDVLTACFEADDGLRPKSEMTKSATARLGAPAWEKLDVIYNGGKAWIASFAPIAFEAARRDDRSAVEVLERNFARVARLIRTARTRCDCESAVVCAGSIASTPEFTQYMNRQGFSVTVPDLPPVYGACVLSAEGRRTVDAVKFEENFRRTLPNK